MPNPFAFISYVLLTTFTPGPNNIMAMSIATRRGFRASMPFSWGVAAGFFVVMAASMAFSATLYKALPGIEPFMKALGAAYILWLAYKVATARPPGEEDGGASGSFWSGILLQFFNPKGILYGITVAATFVTPYYRAPAVLTAFCAFLALVTIASTTTWALFGSAFERFLARYHRLVGGIMAALLVYCAVSLFL